MGRYAWLEGAFSVTVQFLHDTRPARIVRLGSGRSSAFDIVLDAHVHNIRFEKISLLVSITLEVFGVFNATRCASHKISLILMVCLRQTRPAPVTVAPDTTP